MDIFSRVVDLDNTHTIQTIHAQRPNPLGGTTPYNYSWSPSGGGGQTANNLTAGDYTVTITDGMGCTETIDFDMVEPDAITNNFTNSSKGCNFRL